jgi:hypothetical protein
MAIAGPACTDRNVSHDWIERTIGNNATKDRSKGKKKQKTIVLETQSDEMFQSGTGLLP